LKYILLENQYI